MNKVGRWVIIGAILPITMSMNSCSSIDQDSGEEFDSAVGSSWRLLSIEERYSEPTRVNPPDSILLLFGNSGIVMGRAAGFCMNTYQGGWSLAGDRSIQIDSVASTKAACPQSNYWYYLSRLPDVRMFRIDGTLLQLYSSDPPVRLLFERVYVDRKIH